MAKYNRNRGPKKGTVKRVKRVWKKNVGDPNRNK